MILNIDAFNKMDGGVTIVHCATRLESDILRATLHDAGYTWGMSGIDMLTHDFYDDRSVRGADYYIFNDERHYAHIDRFPLGIHLNDSKSRTHIMFLDAVLQEPEADSIDDTLITDFLGALA